MGKRGSRSDREGPGEVTAPAPAKTTTKPSRIHVEWVDAHRFDAGRPGGPTARIDGEGETGQSPPETLLTALATCVSYDVIDILAKQRTPIESLAIDVVGERVETIPRRYKHITLNFKIAGNGIEKDQALRAIELSATKYCSVRDSLSSDMVVDWTVELEDELEEESTGSH
jgi:putative redox protein